MAKAIHKNAAISPQKARLVVDLIRNKSASDAKNILLFLKKKAAGLVRKVLESAIANAEHNDHADVDNLVVSQVYVDEGIKLKRIMPRAKGRSDRYTKRWSNIVVEVSEKKGK
jgi:large subunit ribosomal protein L22